MAFTYDLIRSFEGVRMDLSEYLLPKGSSPDACNMDTRTGALRTAKGFQKAVNASLPNGELPQRLYIHNTTEQGRRYLALTSDRLYLYRNAWMPIHTFSEPVRAETVDFLPIRIGSEDRLLIACGNGQMLTFDAAENAVTPFGSAEMLSDRPVCYAELYFGRLFAAGDRACPSRLYWSKAPGGNRTVEDWRQDPAGENVSGGFVDVGVDDDPITGLFALSNQLLIFKRDTLYRLYGDRPSNYRVLPVDASFLQPLHTGCVRYADRLYFLTAGGLCCYDGQTVRRPGCFRSLEPFLREASMEHVRSAACGDTLYFAVHTREVVQGNDVVIEYDVLRDRYMLRRGFYTADLFGAHGTLYALLDNGKTVRFDDSDTYDGDKIQAWWWTPRFDLGYKEANKTLLSLTADGTGKIAVAALANGGVHQTQITFPVTTDTVAQIPLRGVGHVFRLCFSNVNGEPMTMDASVTLHYDMQRRPV